MSPDGTFDPQEFFDFLLERQRSSGMDPKWMPDYVAVVDDLPMTATQKVKVRELKHMCYDLANHSGRRLLWQQRGDSRYREFTLEDYLGTYEEFKRNGRHTMLAPLP